MVTCSSSLHLTHQYSFNEQTNKKWAKALRVSIPSNEQIQSYCQLHEDNRRPLLHLLMWITKWDIVVDFDQYLSNLGATTNTALADLQPWPLCKSWSEWKTGFSKNSGLLSKDRRKQSGTVHTAAWPSTPNRGGRSDEYSTTWRTNACTLRLSLLLAENCANTEGQYW